MAQCFDEDLEFIVLAEELGFSEFWIGEHHSSTLENIVMPEIFIGKALAMTKTIRLGPAPVCLQYHHPRTGGEPAGISGPPLARSAQRRLRSGAVPSDMEVYGVNPEKSGAMVAEAVDIILRLWTSDPPFEIEGEFWNFSLKEWIVPELGLGHVHKPLQKPHPPIAMPAMRRSSGGMKMAGAKGFLPISHHMLAANVVADNWMTYESAALEAGRGPRRGDWRIARDIFVAETTQEARERARNGSLGKCLEYISRLGDRGPMGRDFWKRDPEMPDSQVNIDYFMNDQIIAGDPDEVVQGLLRMMEETGPFGTLIFTAHDWDDKESWLRCIELFAQEVMPALNREVAVTAPGS